jgi:hypothetical protein
MGKSPNKYGRTLSRKKAGVMTLECGNEIDRQEQNLEPWVTAREPLPIRHENSTPPFHHINLIMDCLV